MNSITLVTSRSPEREAELRAEFEQHVIQSGRKSESWRLHDKWWPTTAIQ